MSDNKDNGAEEVASVWAVCIDTEKDLWKAFVINRLTKDIVVRSSVCVGKSGAYRSLTKEIRKV